MDVETINTDSQGAKKSTDTSNYKKITDMKSEFGALFKRMDDDRKLYHMEDYQMVDNDGQAVPHVQNVTMNDARTFAERAMSLMTGANMQPICKSKSIKEEEKSKIEDFDDAIRTTVDNQLIASNRGLLYDFLIEQACIRGSICGRAMAYNDEEGNIKPEILPIDTRYFVYEFSGDKMIWGAAEYWRSKTQVEFEYQKEVEHFHVSLTKNNNVVQDYWDGQVNERYIGKVKIMENGNPLEEPPYVFIKSGAGSMLMDKGSLQFGGESIFGPVRKLYPEINRLATILQTLNMMTFAGGVQYESDAGEEGVPHDSLHGLWARVPVEKGGGYKLIPVNDVNQATRLFYALIQAAVQRGSLPNIDYGNLTFPLSAVAISKLTQTKDAIFTPRLQAVSLFYRHAHRILKKQIVAENNDVKLGDEGIESEFSPTDIDKPYTMFYRFHTVAPDQDAANAAIAQQQMAIGMPQEYILENTMKVQDPKGLMTKARSERAERMDQALSLYRLGHSLIEVGDTTHDETKYVEARLVLNDLVLLLNARKSGAMTGLNPGADDQQGQQKPLVPVFGGGGNVGGASSPEDEMAEAPEKADERAENRAVTVRKQTAEG